MIGYPSIPTINTSVDKKTGSFSSGRDWTYNENYKWYIEEKLDGSQLSFTLNNKGDEIEFYCRNKRVDKNNSTFSKATTMLQVLKSKLNPNLIYHGEAICKLRHNTVSYDRMPKYYWIMYDIQLKKDKTFLNRQLIEHIATNELNIEIVPILQQGTKESSESPIMVAQRLIDEIESGKLTSYLGGTPEGIVLKHPRFEHTDGKFTSTKIKLTTEKFKEAHFSKKPKELNTPTDFCEWLGSQFNTEARFHKAYQHCRDRNQLQLNNTNNDDNNSKNHLKKVEQQKNRDITLMLKDLDDDFNDEWEEIIKQYLWSEYSEQIRKAARKDFTKWLRKEHSEYE